MNHQPTQLALLISLIGIGAAPHAHANASLGARLDARGADAVQPLPGVLCNELEAAALPACGANTELTWLPAQGPLDRTATAGVRVLYSAAARDDWAPGEVTTGEPARFGHWVPRESVGPAAKAATDAREPRQSSSKSSAKAGGKSTEKRADKTTRKVRVLAQVPTSARVKMPTLTQGDTAIERIERLTPATPVAEAGSKQADRLLESLNSLLYDGPAAPVAQRPPSAEIETAAVPAAAPAESIEVAAAPVVAAAPSAKVLRQLGAILSEERDEVGAIRPQESEAVVTTQTGKVLGMLGEIVAAQPPVEDGPARRLRKLAARAAKAEAQAAADTAAALAAEIARAGVDLMLPLEPPAAAAVLAADRADARLSIEPAALPVDAQFAATRAVADPPARPARKSPFGDRPVALADTSLDRVRGGFSVDGLSISFGIERAVYVNGALVTTTSLNVSDLGRITAGRGTTAFDAGTIGLIQSGAGNVVSPTMISAGSVGTVIQNTLDGQKIQNVTIINATTNSLGVLKGLNLQSSMRGAVIDSLRR